jgi:hypothetical protein
VISRIVVLAVLADVVVAVPRAEAQFLPQQILSSPISMTVQSDSVRPGPNGGGAMLGALVGGAVGLVVVGHVAYRLGGGGRICGDDPCGFLPGFLGALVGEAVGIGLGAHLGDRRRGEALAPVAASLGVLLIAGALNDINGGLPAETVIIIPLAQIVAAVLTETASARAGARR